MTLENIINASSLINTDGKIVVVTGAFHKRRVEDILKNRNLDWTVVSAYGPNTLPENWYKNEVGIEAIIREYEWFM